jgi:hypothetical protein
MFDRTGTLSDNTDLDTLHGAWYQVGQLFDWSAELRGDFQKEEMGETYHIPGTTKAGGTPPRWSQNPADY